MRFWLFFLVLWCATSKASDDYYQRLFGDSFRLENGKIVTNVLRPRGPLFEQLIAQKDSFSDYEGFLLYLKKEFPMLFENALLIHHSQSLQPASLQHPRVVLFDRGTFVAFSEHPGQKGRRVEMIETRPDATLEFREIEFQDGKIDFRSQPKSCIACHSSPARLIWEPYDSWPGAYGSTIGRFGSHEEHDEFKKVLSQKSGIFGHLDFSDLQHEMPGDLYPQMIGNEKMSTNISLVNAFDWIRGLEGIENAPERYLLIGALYCSHDLKFRSLLDKFAPALMAAQLKKNYDDLLADTVKARSLFKLSMQTDYAKIFPNFRRSYTFAPGTPERLIESTQIVAAIRTALEPFGRHHYGVLNPHSMNEYLIESVSSAAVDLLTAFYLAKPRLFDGLKTSIEPGRDGPTWITVDCNQVAEKSKIALKGISLTPQILRKYTDRSPRPGKSVVSNCMSCHSQGPGPRIPFENPPMLKEWLQTKSGLRERILDRISRRDGLRMPLNATLSDSEIEAIKAFIETLR